MLAPSARYFGWSGDVRAHRVEGMPSRLRLTSEGLEMEAVLEQFAYSDLDVYTVSLRRDLIAAWARAGQSHDLYFLRLGCEVVAKGMGPTFMDEYIAVVLVLVKKRGIYHRLTEDSWGVATRDIPRTPVARGLVVVDNTFIGLQDLFQRLE